VIAKNSLKMNKLRPRAQKARVSQDQKTKVIETWISRDVGALFRSQKGAVKALNRVWNEKNGVEVVTVSSQQMKDLTETYLNVRKVTDVLSFESPREVYEMTGFMGQVIVCYPKMESQAAEVGHSVRTEFRVLLAHGLLHLMGWDHERSAGEHEKMGLFERKWLTKTFFKSARSGGSPVFRTGLLSRR